MKAYHTEIAIHQPAGLVYHAHSPRIPSHSLQSRIPSKALVPALRKITTPNLEWLTILSILDTPLRRNEWIQLSSLTNLGTLYIHNTTHESAGGLDDVVIKSWSNSATESGAFPVMKFLMLQNQDGITLGTLEYFSKFPALKVVHLTGRTLRARDGEEAARCSRWSWMSQYVTDTPLNALQLFIFKINIDQVESLSQTLPHVVRRFLSSRGLEGDARDSIPFRFTGQGIPEKSPSYRSQVGRTHCQK